jgi:hypothetical protein
VIVCGRARPVTALEPEQAGLLASCGLGVKVPGMSATVETSEIGPIGAVTDTSPPGATNRQRRKPTGDESNTDSSVQK